MRLLALAFSMSIYAGTAPAALPVNLKSSATRADIETLIANARAKRTNEATYAQPLLGLGPYQANLEYRAVVGHASLHEHEAELFYVVQGAGDLVLGGALVKATRVNGGNLSGDAIEGGLSRRISAGEFFMVPENTPHWFNNFETSGPLVLVSVHLPRR
jgi:mannose-6-phosphate isomerase-like protein (cupin superfamily)